MCVCVCVSFSLVSLVCKGHVLSRSTSRSSLPEPSFLEPLSHCVVYALNRNLQVMSSLGSTRDTPHPKIHICIVWPDFTSVCMRRLVSCRPPCGARRRRCRRPIASNSALFLLSRANCTGRIRALYHSFGSPRGGLVISAQVLACRRPSIPPGLDLGPPPVYLVHPPGASYRSRTRLIDHFLRWFPLCLLTP